MAWVVAVGLLAGAMVVGCEPRVYEDPVGRMMDRGAQPPVRWAAARQAAETLADDPSRIAALKQLVIAPRHPDDLRAYAIDELIEHDESEARAFLRRRIGRLNNWPTIEHLLDRAVERRWVDFTPAIVRSYAREAWAYEDAARPERAALASLHPDKTPAEAALAVFADADGDGPNPTERASAWVLLGRLTGSREAMIAMLDSVEAGDPMAADLEAGLTELAVMPRHTETIAWLQVLRTEPYRPLWRLAAEAAGGLSAAQREGLEVRHVPLLARLRASGDERLGLSRAAMWRRVEGRLRGREMHLKADDARDIAEPQRLEDWSEELSWGDLLVIDAALDAMDRGAARATWFEQAERDRGDASTEYGGLVTWDEGGSLTARPYTAMLRDHDRKFIPPAAMTTDGYAALAQYHFHAQRYANARYAGPGRGDLKRVADRQRVNGLVLTFVGEGRLNVDFYRHGRVSVDLGTIARGGAR